MDTPKSPKNVKFDNTVQRRYLNEMDKFESPTQINKATYRSNSFVQNKVRENRYQAYSWIFVTVSFLKCQTMLYYFRFDKALCS